MMTPPVTASLLAVILLAQGSVSLPWVYPGDFRERLRISDLVVSGTIDRTSRVGKRTVDGTAIFANVAFLRIDRVFKGRMTEEKLQFTWYSILMPTTDGGVVYSGPPLADFHPRKRYMVFLKHSPQGWEVAMPVYAIEEELAAAPPRGAPRDVSQAPAELRYRELADELEKAAMALPTPPPGSTGKAAMIFPSVFDLLGGCAQPFYRRFLSSPSAELRSAASDWLQLIRSRHLECEEPPTRLPR